ncbi:MAG: dTDP-4-dehydrorhamnose reductase [Bacteroidales bacterium]|nr:dTDP-4-dehydrorhamnose reductase [Bacteroidales bacterium]
MTKILITGAKGQLGKEIQRQSHNVKNASFLFMDIDELDLRDEKQVKEIISDIQPSFLVNCAAYTAVDKAEDDEANAFAVNATALQNIIRAAVSVPDMKLIHISTDFVFEGQRKTPYKEDSKTGALSVYGKSKQKGEEYALSYPLSVIIRTSWLYSEFGSNFVKTIMRLSSERDEINVVNDQVGTPTWAADLASAVISIIKYSIEDKNSFIPGIYHYSNEGHCSWYEFAREIKRIEGLDIKINPVSTAEFPLPAERPEYSVLSLDKIKKTYNINIPSWQESLEECIKRIKHKR